MPSQDPAPRRPPTVVELADVALDVAAAMDTPVQVQLGATVFATMVLARSRMPALLAIFTAVGFGFAARGAFLIARDIHQAALCVIEAAAEIDSDADRAT